MDYLEDQIKEKYRILIASPDTWIKSGMRLILKAEKRFNPPEFFSTEDETLHYLKEGRNVDVALIDPAISKSPHLMANGFSKYGNPFIIMPEYQSDYSALRYLRAGMSGYISYEEQEGEILKTIYEVLKGNISFPERIMELSKKHSLMRRPVGYGILPEATFSKREIEIFSLMSQGVEDEDISKIIKCAAITVPTHIDQMCKKIGNIPRHRLRFMALEDKTAGI